MDDSASTTHRFFNRELSWIEFNARVLGEATDPTNPILERLKFLGIVSSNFDEFFMVRIAGFKPNDPLISVVRKKTYDLIAKQHDYLITHFIPELEANGICRMLPGNLNEEQTAHVRNIFKKELFPVLTPIAISDEHPTPSLVNLALYLAVTLAGSNSSTARYQALIEIPKNFPRLVELPASDRYAFILLEDVISFFAAELFPGYEVMECGLLRATRATDMTLDEEKDEDFLKIMEEALKTRRSSNIVRLEIQGSKDLVEIIKTKFGLDDSIVLPIHGWFDLKNISTLAFLPRFKHLRHFEWVPKIKHVFDDTDDMWALIRERDIYLHHPYDSFETVARFVELAAHDPDVLAIKQTLYRIGQDSPIIRSLERAAESGKRVTVLVELKARFDEDSNIEWAKRLERSGASVLYGVAGFKTHAKACLVIRREPDGIKRYVHLATGNYNAKTARQYSDIGIFSVNDELGDDVTAFFNMITGYSQPVAWKKIEVAPYGLKRRLIRLILREAMRKREGRSALIMAKMNALVDEEVMEALYKASQAGVQVKLNVRGICCLKPGVLGLSDNIEVVSVVDMFLEHSRMFYFENGGDRELFLSSADWMPRNLERRIELMFPVEAKEIKSELIDILQSYFRDNTKSWQLASDGTYSKKEGDPKKKFRAQEYMMRKTSERDALAAKTPPLEIKPQKPRPSL